MTDILDYRPTPQPTRIGQQTAVEQSRAVAEVAAAVQVAQANPRSMQRAKDEMRRSCAEYTLAARAFYRYRRGGQEVTGPTVALARELKRCFGNFQSGMGELRRDDTAGQSEMQAWAWDVETNSRSVTVFVVPHENYMTKKPLDALRDVYENNANQGARREREMILGLLPTWYVEEAVQLCRDTIERGNGEPLSIRQDKAEQALRSLGVELVRVERRIGRRKDKWTPQDLADLTVDYQSIKNREIAAEDIFPVTDVTVEDITPTPPPPTAGQPASPATAPPPTAGVERRHVTAINNRFAEIGIRGNGQGHARMVIARHIIGNRPDSTIPETLADLTVEEARLVLDNLAGDAGRDLAVDVLRRDGAPEWLVPAAPADPGEPPEGDVDPTMEPGWPSQ